MRWFAIVGLLAGCYRPGADPACLTRCDPAAAGQADACPGSLRCAEDGRCREPDGTCGGSEVDGAVIDMRPDDSTAYCYGHGLLRVCLDAEPSGALQITSMSIDTASATCAVVPQTNGPDLCVIAATTVQLANVRAIGPRPLVVIATDRITLGGVIDVASRRIEGSGVAAAGSNDARCAGTSNPLTGAGGNGGSFGGIGGKGGRSGVNPQASVDPQVLRGGCPGTDGNPSALGGRGGGAIYFIAETGISVGTATINASGAGGSTAIATGGGGGSGGMIGFDAPSLTVTTGGQAFANGGGGAGGSQDSSPGSAGTESPSAQFPGEGGLGTGANGGEGSLVSLDGLPGEGVSSSGGGGGGGAGVIVIYPVSQAGAFGTAVSPPVTQ